jgi:hypothetical protein
VALNFGFGNACKEQAMERQRDINNTNAMAVMADFCKQTTHLTNQKTLKASKVYPDFCIAIKLEKT